MGKTKLPGLSNDDTLFGNSREMAKQELRRNLSRLIPGRDWNQSDLARAADLPRELISSYVLGRSFPEPKSLRRIADALGTTPEALAPSAQGVAAESKMASWSITGLPGQQGRVLLRVHREVTRGTAMKISELLDLEP